jgi:glucosamine--fructose-6-phosphate aminotransferase (isomerizing)
MTRAGPEIGVASTKAFIAQLTLLAAFTIAAARARGRMSAIESSLLIAEMNHIAGEIDTLLQENHGMDAAASMIAQHDHALFLGRGAAYPVAEEGALKLKEVSYIHAEAYPAGELKHGPIALVDDTLPVVVIAPPDELFNRTLSNLREVAARGGRIVLLSDAEGIDAARPFIEHGIVLPPASNLLAPLMYTLPLQVIAYRVGLLRGTDIDQPRNLAKSVTVE